MGAIADTSTAIATLGRELGPDQLAACQALFSEAQWQLAEGQATVASDVAYGPAGRQKLDLYRSDQSDAAPVLLWVHGGGFTRGDKASPGSPFNAHIGRWAARHGYVGAVMNYRFAPSSTWPSGIEDVAAAVAWIEAHGAVYGIDPERVILAGTSAGAVHVAGYVAHGPSASIKGAILLSGLYGVTPLDPQDEQYYGPQSDYAERMPFAGIVATDLPLFVACAEYDPPRFQQEYAGLIAARLDRQDAVPTGAVVGGHNHFTLAMHIGTSDTRLADQILAFIASVSGAPS